MPNLVTLFCAILADLRAAIGTHLGRDRTYEAWLALAWQRIGRMSQRFQRLYHRWQAGTLPKPRPSRAGQSRPERPKPPYFPRHHAWLAAKTDHNVRSLASQLTHLLARPDLDDFLKAAPQAGRILRPLCHMLGIEPPAPAILPAKPRAPRTRPESPPSAPVHHGKYTPAQIRKYRPGRISGRMAKPA
ncbi:MAG: hypothetical protein IT555_09360 [Acetobacteraceae bacterium]|nr:hypothetical protein [Acetobacteraceae bacterium]